MYPNPMQPYQPYGMQFRQQLPQMMDNTPRDLIRVTGIEGAKAYQMPPNSRAALLMMATTLCTSRSRMALGSHPTSVQGCCGRTRSRAHPTMKIMLPVQNLTS